MNKFKTIQFISDLEGTLINDGGIIDEEKFYQFISELSKFAEALDTKASISIVSPMGPSYMKRMLDILDKITSICLRNRGKFNVSIDAAIADANDCRGDEFFIRDKRIIELTSRKPLQSRGADIKTQYTRELLRANKRNGNSDLHIYAGNGSNDIPAMQIIKDLPNGVTMCPANSPNTVKSISILQSSLSGPGGITDCVRQLHEKYRIRLGIELPKDSEKEIKKE